MSRKSIRNSNNLKKIWDKMSINIGPLHPLKQEKKKLLKDQEKINSEQTKKKKTEMILNSLDMLPIQNEEEKNKLIEKKTSKNEKSKKELNIQREEDTSNYKGTKEENEQKTQSRKEPSSIREIRKETSQTPNISESIQTSSYPKSEISNSSIESQIKIERKKNSFKNKMKRSREKEEDSFSSSSSSSINSVLVEKIRDIAENERMKKRANNSDSLKNLAKRKYGKRKFIGERKKCKICGEEISLKSEKYHLLTKHKGKGLKDIEKENCLIEYSKRRCKKISVLLNDIDNLRKEIEINGTSDYNIFLRNMNQMRESCNSILNINKRKKYIFKREAQGKIPL